MIRYPTRLRLGHWPTPIEKLERLTRQLGGPEIWVKRDDQSGLATGGNKARKLEFLFADALAQQCDHVVTLGGPQSNHVRQTAAAAARLGLGCSLVLRGNAPAQKLGNLLLDELLGAKVHWSGAQAGMVLGAAARGFRGRVLGISIDSSETELTAHVIKIANEAATIAKASSEIASKLAPTVCVNADFLGGGYAVVGDLERDAIRTVACTEGLLLDPVYTGRAMGGLIELVRRGVIGKKEQVLFWHTGGTAALSAFAEKL